MARPPRIFCLGRNFAAHAAEMGHKVAAEPMIFLKNPLSIIGPDESVEIPVGLGRIEHEVEVAVVIGREGKAIAPADADLFVAGYTLFNDVTARDVQKADQEKKWPWTRAKGPDTFGPMGPWLVTPDEFGWPPQIQLCLSVNGEPRQWGNTEQWVFGIGEVLAFISRTMRLVPGDVVSMGTPEGVGPITAGDVVECHAEGLGTLRNPVIWQPTEKGLELPDA
ncbi:fumarylacetoacetate hydrolase family protein [bacterium]|nr:fumarylacetoacetate hydrolase family protein [bacterium]